MPDFLTEPVEQFTQTRYRCPYCRRSWTSLKRANAHRDECWYNRGCKTCRHADTWGGSWVNSCELGENLLTDPEEPQRAVPRSQCPLWEAVS
jgi:hypothetical protein